MGVSACILHRTIHAVGHGFEHTHTIREKTLGQHAIHCGCGGHPYLFKRQNHFLTCHTSWMWLYRCYFETAMYNVWVWEHPQLYLWQGIKTHGCMDTHEVSPQCRFQLKVTCGESYNHTKHCLVYSLISQRFPGQYFSVSKS